LSLSAAAEGHQAPLHLVGSGPHFQLELPAAVYPGSLSADLRELRIRNASGDAVPYSWVNSEAPEVTIRSSTPALFPIPAAGANTIANDLQLELKQSADGSLIALRSAPAAGLAPAASDWIIDTSQLTGRFLQARFTLAADAAGLFPLTLDASDDLRQWRSIVRDGQLAILKHEGVDRGGAIEKLDIDLHGAAGHYLRLRWRDPAHAATIVGVTIDTIEHAEAVPQLSWSNPIDPETCAVDYCDYRLPVNTPVDSLRVNLSAPNTLAPISIASLVAVPDPDYRHTHLLYALRHKRLEPPKPEINRWTLANSVVYRLSQPQGELRSDDIVLNGGVYPTLRLYAQGAELKTLGSRPPTLQVATVVRKLVFLATGAAPFELSWGEKVVGAGPLPLATLIPGYRVDQPLQASMATVVIDPLPTSVPQAVSPADTAVAAAAAKRVARRWLWVALAGGLLLLAAMAWSLFRSMARPDRQPPPT